jgi:hypothetical protein
MTHLVTHLYCRVAYRPTTLRASGIGEYPASHRLHDVPWISTQVPVCAPTSLQMIAAQRGREVDRRRVDFLMGFSYGAGERPGAGWLPVGTDPEAGSRFAAPYLGLRRRCFVTGDASLFLAGMRHWLSAGRAVQLPVDMGVLYGWNDRIPHYEVLVGYDQASFRYYEPVCRPPLACRPGRTEAGSDGMRAPEGLLLDAVRGLSRTFEWPWPYAFSIFEPGEYRPDIARVFRRSGRALAGGPRSGMCWGAVATERLAGRLDDRSYGPETSGIRLGLEIAAFGRAENAAFLRGTWGSDANIARAAASFERAADDYLVGQQAMGDATLTGAAEAEVSMRLRDAAEAEREAGRVFLSPGLPERFPDASAPRALTFQDP